MNTAPRPRITFLRMTTTGLRKAHSTIWLACRSNTLVLTLPMSCHPSILPTPLWPRIPLRDSFSSFSCACSCQFRTRHGLMSGKIITYRAVRISGATTRRCRFLFPIPRASLREMPIHTFLPLRPGQARMSS